MVMGRRNTIQGSAHVPTICLTQRDRKSVVGIMNGKHRMLHGERTKYKEQIRTKQTLEKVIREAKGRWSIGITECRLATQPRDVWRYRAREPRPEKDMQRMEEGN